MAALFVGHDQRRAHALADRQIIALPFGLDPGGAPELQLPQVRARAVAARHERGSGGADVLQRFGGVFHAADLRRIGRRADDDEVVVHHVAPLHAEARGDELLLRLAIVDQHHVGIALLADLQRGAGAYRHVLHGDAGSAAKLRQQVVEQPGVGGAGGGRHPHCLSLCGGGAQQGCQSENDALDHERDCTWAPSSFFFDSIERIRYAAALAIALAGLLALVVLALLVGRYPLSLSDLPMLKTVMLEIRGPRVLAAALVGASLAAAGTVYQGILRNPLVSPDILGVSSGAALGAVLAMLLSLQIIFVQIFAFGGGLLAVPDDEARTLGADPGRLRLLVIAAATLMTAAAVAISGIIGWIGLLVPHAARLLVGPGFGRLLPLAMLLGAAFLLAVDTLCRAATAVELPPGVVTALIGTPLFLWLFALSRRSW